MASNLEQFRTQHAAQRARLLSTYPRGGSHVGDGARARLRLAQEARWLAGRAADLAQQLDAATLPRPTAGAYRSAFMTELDDQPVLVEYEFDFDEDHRGADLQVRADCVWFGGTRLRVAALDDNVAERLDTEALRDFLGNPVADAPISEPSDDDAARAEDAYIARLDSINAAREVAL